MAVQVRRDTAAVWQLLDPTLAEGEFGVETDTSKIKIGDGTNSWKSLTYLSDSVAPLSLIVQGSNYNYSVAGTANTAINSSPSLTDIQRWSVTSDGNASDIGDITAGRVAGASATSTTHGYVAGGLIAPPNARNNTIYKFAFTSPYTATDVGDLLSPVSNNFGSSSPTDGYSTGGRTPPGSTRLTTHNKYPFASDTNSTDDGDLADGREALGAGHSSALASYFCGGTPSTPTNPQAIIDKIPFAAGGTSTDVGDMIEWISQHAASNSPGTGYIMGFAGQGGDPETSINRVQTFSFASDGDAEDTQDLFAGVIYTAGSSSTTSGYVSGGKTSYTSPTPRVLTNMIQKFPFANTTTGTDVGDLATAVTHNHGNQS